MGVVAGGLLGEGDEVSEDVLVVDKQVKNMNKRIMEWLLIAVALAGFGAWIVTGDGQHELVSLIALCTAILWDKINDLGTSR